MPPILSLRRQIGGKSVAAYLLPGLHNQFTCVFVVEAMGLEPTTS